MTARDRSRIWIEEGRADLETARVLMDAGRYNASVFYCQQAAEKAMKALLLKLHQAPWGHSVWNLYLNASEITGVQDEAVEAAAKGLDLHYVPSRYPDALPPNTRPSEFYDRGKAVEAMSWAQRIMDYVARVL